ADRGHDGHGINRGAERYKLSAPKARFRACEKSKLPLISEGLSQAFQADDEGSIPFTRSSDFKHLHHGHSDILTSRLLLILTIVRRSFAPRAARRFLAPFAT